MIKNLLVAETDRIGDVVLTFPVFKSIKKHNPRIRVTALIREYTRDLFRYFPYVDDIISYTSLKSREAIQNLLKEIKERDFDTALALHPEYPVAKIIRLAGVKNRYSYGWKWYQYLFTKVIIQHRSRNLKHQLEYNLELLKLLPIPKTFTGIRLRPGTDEIRFVNHILKQHRLKSSFFVGIHPGSGHSSLNLPPDKYIELIEKIKRKFRNAEIFLTGSNQEKALIEYIMLNTKIPLHPMPLNLSLAHLIALISRMKVFLSNSTGPMHIASALGVPVVAFFSPVFIHSPVRWGPYWGKRLVVRPEGPCHEHWKCRLKRCGSYNCFDQIDFAKTLEFIRHCH